jgi:hypothetical protein
LEDVYKLIVFSLGMEVNDSSFVKLAWLRLINNYVLDSDKLLKELLEIFFDNVEVKIIKKTFVDVVGLNDFLHCPACSQNQVCCSKVMH